MKAAVVHEFTKPLMLEDVPTPEPGPGEVLVKIETSGLCHTDIHAAHGDWPVKPKLPLIPGHEGVGIIERVGRYGLTGLTEGDRVALPWLGSCLRLLRGLPDGLGDTVRKAAQHRLLHRRQLRRVRQGQRALRRPGAARGGPARHAPLTCAGVTTYKGAESLGAQPTDLVAVFGIGGLGHLALQYARSSARTWSRSTSWTKSSSWPGSWAPTTP